MPSVIPSINSTAKKNILFFIIHDVFQFLMMDIGVLGHYCRKDLDDFIEER
jgi:hypothetical protein